MQGKLPFLRLLTTFCITCLTAFLFGCAGGSQRPMATSLSDLSSETTTRETDLVGYHEIISVAGSLPIPDVGGLYYYPQPKLGVLQMVGRSIGNFFWRPSSIPSPAYMIPISDAFPEHSFRLSLESTTTNTDEDVATLAKTIGDFQDAVTESVRLTMRIATIDAKFAAKLPNISTNDLSNERSNLVARLATNDGIVTNLQHQAREQSSKPGIIVARWVIASEAGGTLGVGQVAGLSGSRQHLQSGYIILGGWRASAIYFGRDFEAYLAGMGPVDIYLFKKANAGIVSYVLQSKHISYVSGIDLQSAFGAYANVNVKNFQNNLKNIDQINVAAYMVKAANMSNAGNPGEVHTTKEELSFAGTISGTTTSAVQNVGFEKIIEMVRPNNAAYHSRPVPLFTDISTNSSWKTIQAMVVSTATLASGLEQYASKRAANGTSQANSTTK